MTRASRCSVTEHDVPLWIAARGTSGDLLENAGAGLGTAVALPRRGHCAPTREGGDTPMMRKALSIALGMALIVAGSVAAGPLRSERIPTLAPRGADVQAPRGQDFQAPRGEDVQAPRGEHPAR